MARAAAGRTDREPRDSVRVDGRLHRIADTDCRELCRLGGRRLLHRHWRAVHASCRCSRRGRSGETLALVVGGDSWWLEVVLPMPDVMK